MQSTHYFESYIDHPSLKGNSRDRIFRMEDGNWLFLKGVELRGGIPIRLTYTNLGDPYRELVYLDYVPNGAKGNESILLHLSDGETLYKLGIAGDRDTVKRLGWR